MATNESHKKNLMALLREEGRAMSLTALSEKSALQKSAVSAILRDAAFWGELTQWVEGPEQQTYFSLPQPALPRYIAMQKPWRSEDRTWSDLETPANSSPEFKLLNYLRSGFVGCTINHHQQEGGYE
jgi:hypothetical protein